MQEQPPHREGPDPQSAVDIEELARCLDEADHWEPETRARVAGLLDELAAELGQPDSSEHADHLAQITAQLVRAVKDRHEPGVIGAARERLDDAITKAEAKSPVVTDIALRLLDVLTGMGI